MSVVLWVGYSSGHLPSSWPQTVDHTCGRHKSEHTLDFPTAELTVGKEEIVREEKMLARGECVPKRAGYAYNSYNDGIAEDCLPL